MGCNANGRRHSSGAWTKCGDELTGTTEQIGALHRGKKLVVQVLDTMKKNSVPCFVDELDAVKLAQNAGLDIEPVMIYGDEVTHVVTEQGIAYLYRTEDRETRRKALQAIAGATPFGRGIEQDAIEALRREGIVAYAQDLGIRATDAKRSLLAAQNMEQLVEWSGGLYQPPAQFKSW